MVHVIAQCPLDISRLTGISITRAGQVLSLSFFFTMFTIILHINIMIHLHSKWPTTELELLLCIVEQSSNTARVHVNFYVINYIELKKLFLTP